MSPRHGRGDIPLDSSGIRSVLYAQHDAAAQAVVLCIVSAHRRVTKMLATTGVLQLMQNVALPR